MGESFVAEVEGLLSKGELYEDVEQFASSISQLIDSDKPKALNLLFSMVKLAKSKFQSKDPAVLKQVKPWLQKLSKAFDTYNLREHFPSSKGKEPEPQGKKRDRDGNIKETGTDNEKKRVIENVNNSSQKVVEGKNENGTTETDKGNSDASIKQADKAIDGEASAKPGNEATEDESKSSIKHKGELNEDEVRTKPEDGQIENDTSTKETNELSDGDANTKVEDENNEHYTSIKQTDETVEGDAGTKPSDKVIGDDASTIVGDENTDCDTSIKQTDEATDGDADRKPSDKVSDDDSSTKQGEETSDVANGQIPENDKEADNSTSDVTNKQTSDITDKQIPDNDIEAGGSTDKQFSDNDKEAVDSTSDVNDKPHTDTTLKETSGNSADVTNDQDEKASDAAAIIVDENQGSVGLDNEGGKADVNESSHAEISDMEFDDGSVGDVIDEINEEDIDVSEEQYGTETENESIEGSIKAETDLKIKSEPIGSSSEVKTEVKKESRRSRTKVKSERSSRERSNQDSRSPDNKRFKLDNRKNANEDAKPIPVVLGGQSASLSMVDDVPKVSENRIRTVKHSIYRYWTMPRRLRESMCLDPKCEVEVQNGGPKPHALLHHIPRIFDPRILNVETNILDMRIEAMLDVARWLKGNKATLQDLQYFVDSLQCFTFKDKVTETCPQYTQMREFCHHLALPVPHTFKFCPLNSLACLLYWKVLYIFYAMLQKEHRDIWLEKYKTNEDCLIYTTAVDAFFHPKMSDSYNINEHREETVFFEDEEGKKGINIFHSVANFSDPHSYPNVKELSSLPKGLIPTIGIHPRHASRSKRYIEEALLDFQHLVPYACGVGEIGIDHTEDPSYWPDQIILLQKLLPLIPIDKPVTICCKGMTNDDHTEAHFVLLQNLRGLSSDQKIHVHSFMGNSVVVKWWLDAFPNTVFGYNSSVANFNAAQTKALVDMDYKGFVLESDAHYPFRKGRALLIDTPRKYLEAAEVVAKLREISVGKALFTAKNTALRIYGRSHLNSGGF